MPALTTLRRPLLAFTALGIAFIGLSVAVASGWLARPDRLVQAQAIALDQPVAIRVAQLIAILGGIEVTGLLLLGLLAWMLRSRLVPECWALVTYPVTIGVELVYKHLVNHPPPSHSHLDGPTLLQLLRPVEAAANGAGSFPSGHMTRAVLAYGLVAFVVTRFAERRWVGGLAVAGAVVLCLAVAVTRVYLGVHWESDVIGGLLLGGLALVASVLWLDRPW